MRSMLFNTLDKLILCFKNLKSKSSLKVHLIFQFSFVRHLQEKKTCLQ